MYFSIKRLLDLVVSITLLILTFPLFLFIALSIKFFSGKGQVFYKGIRASKGAGTFNLFKFRTMVHDAERIGGPSTAINDSRLTAIGRFLRKYKLDELPQFLNVIIGDMSLVGPRPQVLDYTNEYKGDELIILDVLPGITDLASLSFSNLNDLIDDVNPDLSYENKILKSKNLLRIKYVKNASFWGDIKLIILTIYKLTFKS